MVHGPHGPQVSRLQQDLTKKQELTPHGPHVSRLEQDLRKKNEITKKKEKPKQQQRCGITQRTGRGLILSTSAPRSPCTFAPE